MIHASQTIPAPTTSLLHRADAVLGRIVAFLAAGILLVEVLLLLANVIARYVFNRPLVWGDELASILFVWLCDARRRAGDARATSTCGSPRWSAACRRRRARFCDVVVLTVVSRSSW